MTYNVFKVYILTVNIRHILQACSRISVAQQTSRAEMMELPSNVCAITMDVLLGAYIHTQEHVSGLRDAQYTESHSSVCVCVYVYTYIHLLLSVNTVIWSNTNMASSILCMYIYLGIIH